MLLQKVFRALPRYWAANNIEEHDLVEADYNFMLNCMEVRVRKENENEGIPQYCEAFLALHISLQTGAFEENASGEGDPELAGKNNKRKATRVPAISADRSIEWLNNGLATSFAADEFIQLFFDSLAELVYAHAITPPNVFGVEVQITTDDSITAALAQLPPGYREVLMHLQYHIGERVCLNLFYYSLDHANELGGPGSAVRLVIDMIESQLFSTAAIANNAGFKDITKKDGTVTTTVAFMAELITQSLGPYPVNMAFGPILQHILYLEAANGQSICIDYFLQHCASDQGFAVHPVHGMGLLTMISAFILNPVPAQKSNRFEGLLCRSQIPEEQVWKQYPVETLRRIMDRVCALEEYDDFVILVFAAAAGLMRLHGTALMSHTHVRKLYDLLIADPADMKQLLNDKNDPQCYETLVGACKQILNL